MNKRIKFFILTSVLGLSFYIKGQTKNNIQLPNSDLIKTWYESPHENSGDTTVFRSTKYVKITGVDSHAFEFCILSFNNPIEFSVQYWNWCPAVNYENNGIWSQPVSGKLILDFGINKCKCEIKLISLSADKLKAVIKEIN